MFKSSSSKSGVLGWLSSVDTCELLLLELKLVDKVVEEEDAVDGGVGESSGLLLVIKLAFWAKLGCFPESPIGNGRAVTEIVVIFFLTIEI